MHTRALHDTPVETHDYGWLVMTVGIVRLGVGSRNWEELCEGNTLLRIASQNLSSRFAKSGS